MNEDQFFERQCAQHERESEAQEVRESDAYGELMRQMAEHPDKAAKVWDDWSANFSLEDLGAAVLFNMAKTHKAGFSATIMPPPLFRLWAESIEPVILRAAECIASKAK